MSPAFGRKISQKYTKKKKKTKTKTKPSQNKANTTEERPNREHI